MATTKSLDLEPIITGLCYRKTETLTETEIRQAINTAILNFGIEYVTALPTGEDIKQKIYIMPDTTQTTGNFGDIYVYDRTNSNWVHIDALKFNIDEYLKISDILDNLTSTSSNKALSANQGRILKGLIDTNADNISSLSTNKQDKTDSSLNTLNKTVTGAINELNSSKSDSNHTHDNRYYTETETDNLLDTKVDKVTGKGLSANDFTDALKSKLENDVLTNHQDITGKVDKVNGANTMTDSDAYNNIGTSSGATQKQINAAINNKLTTIVSVSIDYDDDTSKTYNLYGTEVVVS